MGRANRRYFNMEETQELQELLRPTILRPERMPGYVIKYTPIGPGINKMLYRALHGRVLTQTQRSKTYKRYYPGYLHNVPYLTQKIKGGFFLPAEYDPGPIKELIEQYGHRCIIYDVEAYDCEPHTLLTGFQRAFVRATLKGVVQDIEWLAY